MAFERFGLLEYNTLKEIYNTEREIKRLKYWKKMCLAESNSSSLCSPYAMQSPVDILRREDGNIDFSEINQEMIFDRFDELH